MDKNYSELIEYLDGKFTRVDDRFELVDERFEKINERFDKVDIRIDQLITVIDKLAKAIEDLKQEYSAIAMIIDKHEKWIHQIAEKLGIKLEY
ncbi:MAG: hypothetical protein COU82_01625 [Candidatus Portnoybacteria bacterium CG10_big_fil_rev_8_21_14_0_10_38_18]|uniref:t-SNARE coiled-coil homology domain-containing protein n=1 Tax=Candidatus Portnoybacteria bacterium CG10_big_fil_rev_8_21_14_0_10_38_18 TaxID=1974813 RepID=A0A2M8KC57_9BACT|nr:MAG: hypothetical protein COU82_01625 [Candidatus Portnoybacteria bacterium CG10_big_fil_rev_8_21_14_0_10_38_18]